MSLGLHTATVTDDGFLAGHACSRKVKTAFHPRFRLISMIPLYAGGSNKDGGRKILISSASSVVIRMRCVSGVGYLLISTGTSQFRVASTQDEENLPGKNDMSERGMRNVYFRICGVFCFRV